MFLQTKTKFLTASVLILFLMSCFVAQAGFLSSEENAKSICTLTYEQGYNVGSSLGNSETYPDENYQMYLKTLEDFAYCGDYVVGVMEGYTTNQYTGEYNSGVDTYSPCGIGTMNPDCNKGGKAPSGGIQ